MWWCSARQKHEIPGISFRQTGNWTPEDEIFGINCRNVAPKQRNVSLAKREILSHRNGRFPPFETTLRSTAIRLKQKTHSHTPFEINNPALFQAYRKSHLLSSHEKWIFSSISHINSSLPVVDHTFTHHGESRVPQKLIKPMGRGARDTITCGFSIFLERWT